LRRILLFTCAVAALVSIAAAQSITARIDGQQLHVMAPRVHFLIGEALQRLRDGATVNYEMQLTARPDRAGKLLGRAVEHFSVSYDLWEEKFAVTRLGGSPKSVSHLSAPAAEVWCIDNTLMPIGVLPPAGSFWLRLDYRAEEPSSTADQNDNSSFSLSSLVDIFSRRVRREQVHGTEEVGPLRLSDLKRK
jgi:hypothetical protein